MLLSIFPIILHYKKLAGEDFRRKNDIIKNSMCSDFRRKLSIIENTLWKIF